MKHKRTDRDFFRWCIFDCQMRENMTASIRLIFDQRCCDHAAEPANAAAESVRAGRPQNDSVRQDFQFIIFSRI